MQRIFLVFILFFTLTAVAQKSFGRKYQGLYTGIQESYDIVNKEEVYTITKGEVEITLQKTKVSYRVDDYKVYGTLELIAKTKEYFALKVKLENGRVEYWNLYRKEKKIHRKAIAPEPDSFLFKN